MSPLIEKFSDSYYVLDVDTIEHGGTSVAVSNNLYEKLCRRVELPFLKLGTQHYLVDDQWGIPSETIIVPRRSVYDSDEPVLMPTDPAAAELVARGDWVEEIPG